ncbi:MAG: glycerol-3-phosphate dehydrogenase [Roseiarcus sp.]|jgi:glycerol-3-phosphate dehydrogenase
MSEEIFDVAIIGGGINGCGIARDAAGRGLKVYLCEKGDLASGTSSASTKLIHGGLRYLEHYEFRLVREALMEREALWAIAPHLVRPLRFILPYHKGLRPAWLLRLGLFFYDHIGGRHRLPATKTVRLDVGEFGAPLRAGEFSSGFEFSDCWVDDARLVTLNACDAAEHGAVIETRTEAVSGHREGSIWLLKVATRDGLLRAIRSKSLVNAAGPWVTKVLETIGHSGSNAKVRLVQGSHIVIPRLFDHDRCYLLQNADGRIVFVIPYESDFSLIGTTDRDFEGNLSAVAASPDEIAYLCATVGEYFHKPLRPSDVVWTYSGVRPLYDDGADDAQAATRDNVLEIDAPKAQAPLLSIFGGKITTYRRLAEAALTRLSPYFPGLETRAGWTARAPLPGGEIPVEGIEGLKADLGRQYPFLSATHACRLARSYGRRTRRVLGSAASLDDLGRQFGADLTEAEVRYLMDHEWAINAEDVVWRRSKLGLRMSCAEIDELEVFMRRAAGLVTRHAASAARAATATLRAR